VGNPVVGVCIDDGWVEKVSGLKYGVISVSILCLKDACCHCA